MWLLLHPGRGAEYCDHFVCLSVSISLEPLDLSPWNFLCRSPVAVVRFSSGGIVMHYVLPVLWMTSRLAVVGRMMMHGRLNFLPTTISSIAILGRSLMSMNALLCNVIVTGVTVQLLCWIWVSLYTSYYVFCVVFSAVWSSMYLLSVCDVMH